LTVARCAAVRIGAQCHGRDGIRVDVGVVEWESAAGRRRSVPVGGSGGLQGRAPSVPHQGHFEDRDRSLQVLESSPGALAGACGAGSMP
jgi:hypothetical protein